MAKSKTVYFCQNCGAESAKWIGRCPACGEWNTYIEQIVSKSPKQNVAFYEHEKSTAIKVSDIEKKSRRTNINKSK